LRFQGFLTLFGCALISRVYSDSYPQRGNSRSNEYFGENAENSQSQSSEGSKFVDSNLISRIVRLVNRNEAQTRFAELGRKYPRENGFRGLVEPMFIVEMPERVTKVGEFHDRFESNSENDDAQQHNDFKASFSNSQGRFVLQRPIVRGTGIASFMLDDWTGNLSGKRVPKLEPF